jgi:hypothetical protein
MASTTSTRPSSSNDEFVRCLRCKKVVIAVEYDGHHCSPRITDSKHLEFDYYAISKDALGREMILIKAMDGTLFSFIKREKKESDKERFMLPPPSPS